MSKGSGFITGEDIFAEMVATEQRDAEVGPQSPEHSKMYEFQEDAIHLYWGGYDYDITYQRIQTPHLALNWILHLSEKGWEHMTVERINYLLEDLYGRYGWSRDS